MEVPSEVIISLKNIYGKQYRRYLSYLRITGILQEWFNIKKCILSQNSNRVTISCTHDECIDYVFDNYDKYDFVTLTDGNEKRVRFLYLDIKKYILSKGNIHCMDDSVLEEMTTLAIENNDMEIIQNVSVELLNVLCEDILLAGLSLDEYNEMPPPDIT